jgi:hypothetical protein
MIFKLAFDIKGAAHIECRRSTRIRAPKASEEWEESQQRQTSSYTSPGVGTMPLAATRTRSTIPISAA